MEQEHAALTAADATRLAALARFDHLCALDSTVSQRRRALCAAMRATPHGRTSNTLEHGLDTWRHYARLRQQALAGTLGANEPAWLHQHGRALALAQCDMHTMRRYLVMHDCGKPAALVRDEAGRLHFPEHADRSAMEWARAGGTPLECELMRKDMLLHTLGSEDARELAADPLAPSLLLAALAEIRSNTASVFGGPDSTSTRIKTKALDRRARALCGALFG